MARKQKNTSVLNHVMCINEAAIENKCEDTYAYSFFDNYGMLAVFDGCGGIGAKRYCNCNNDTAAYISARIASGTVLEWFEEQITPDQAGLFAAPKDMIGSLKKALDGNYEKAKEKLDTEKNRLVGSLIRSFPATASIALVSCLQKDYINCNFLWAGDSRGYILRSDGIKQCTMDDLKIEEDSFENLYADSPLSNMINGDGNYSINHRKIKCELPAMVITATDGVFGYLPSPMHFEKMLIDTLLSSQSFEEWEDRLSKKIKEVTGDDSTAIIALYGWKNYASLKEDFRKRSAYLAGIIGGDMNVDELRAVWNDYKSDYYVEDVH